MLLRVLPNATALRAAREAALEEKGVWLGPGPVTLRELVEAFLEEAGAASAPDRPALMEAARWAVEGSPLERAAAQPGLLGGLVRVWERLAAAGPEAGRTVTLIEALGRPRLSELARGFTAFSQTLAGLGLSDPQARVWLAGQACRRAEAWPEMLHGRAGVRVEGVESFSPAQVDLLVALAEQGLRVEVHLPFLAGPGGQGLNEAGFGPFERLADLSADLEVVADNLDREAPPGLKALLRAVVDQPPPRVDPGDCLVRFRAASRYQELEEAGRRIRALLEAGVPPGRIGLVRRSLAGLTGQMIEDVGRRFSLPLDMRRGQPLSETGPVRALLAGLSLALDGPQRSNLIKLVESAYFRPDNGSELKPGQALQTLLAAGFLPGRSQSWRRALEESGRQIDPSLKNLTRARVEGLIRTFAPWSGPLRPGPALAELIRLLDSMNLAEEPPWLARRERAAAAELREALAGLSWDLDRLGGLDSEISPGRFLGLVQSALAERTVAWGRQEPGGVKVLRLEDAAGLDFDYLFLSGLVEGQWPGPAEADPFVDDEDKLRLNRALGGRLFSTAAEHYARERLLFLRLLGSARRRVFVSRSTDDGQGKPILASALWAWLDGALSEGAAPEAAEPGPGPPGWADLLGPDELVGRLSLDLLSPEADSPDLARAVLDQLQARPGWSARLDSIQARAGIEREREFFLLQPDRDKAKPWLGPYVGRLASPAALEALARWLGDPAGARLSIQALEAYAGCPFSFLAQYLWRAGLEEPPGPTPAALGEGELLHQVLRRLNQEALEAGRWPPEVKDLAPKAAPAIEAWRNFRPRGHGRLVDLAVQEVLAMVRAVLAWEAATADQGWRPWRLEYTLPPLELDLAGGGKVMVQGRADRVDQGPEGLRVLDYKKGARLDTYSRLIREAGQTAFQLPVYLTALAQEHPGEPLEAAYLLARLGRLSTGITWDQTRSRELKERLQAILEDIRRGVFDLQPRNDCGFCRLAPLCRYQAPLTSAEETA